MGAEHSLVPQSYPLSASGPLPSGAAKAPHVRSYEGLRHSFGTKLVNQGVSMDVTRKAMGHADVRSTELYARLADGAVVRAIKPRRGDR
jgi:site-specific recombinase XerD